MCVKGRKAKCWHGNAGYSKHPAPAAPQIGSISSWTWWCSDYDRHVDDEDDNEDEDDDEDDDDDTWQGKEEKSRLADFTFCRPLPFLQFIHFPLGSSQSLSLSLILSLPVDLFLSMPLPLSFVFAYLFFVSMQSVHCLNAEYTFPVHFRPYLYCISMRSVHFRLFIRYKFHKFIAWSFCFILKFF